MKPLVKCSLMLAFAGALVAPLARKALSADTPATTEPVLFITNNGDESAASYDPTTGDQLTSFQGLKNPIGITVVTNGSISGSMVDMVDVVNNGNGTVSQFDAAGNLVNPALIKGLGQAWSAVSSGSNLYVSTSSGIKEFNALTGQVENASFITGVNASFSMALAGNDLYVANFTTGTVGVYDATTGAAINASLITGVSHPFGLAVADGELFVASETTNSVGVFNLQTGVAINASLVTGVDAPTGVAVWNNNLYVLSSFDGTVGEFDATTGMAINTSFITGLSNPEGISLAQLNIPEPGVWSLLLGAAGVGLGLGRFRKQPSQTPALPHFQP